MNKYHSPFWTMFRKEILRSRQKLEIPYPDRYYRTNVWDRSTALTNIGQR